MPPIDVYLEEGRRRVFAGAIEWPGWCRSARDAESALAALLAYGPRYARTLGGAARTFKPPVRASAFRAVERLIGDATTDFGAPGIAPAADARELDARELKHHLSLLEACWTAFDAAAKRAAGAVLSKGPRGGGRELDAIVRHVLEADNAYQWALGWRHRPDTSAATAKQMSALRKAFLEGLAARARGEPPAPSRRTKPAWTPRYAIRRSAWHALDHAWEIEDRAQRPGKGKRASG